MKQLVIKFCEFQISNYLAVTSKYRSQLVTISFMGYAGGSVVLGLITFIFTTAHSLSLACIGFIIVGSFLNFFVMKEPPRFLFRKGKISEGFRILEQLAKINKANVSQNQILELMKYPSNDKSKNPFKNDIVLQNNDKTKKEEPQESMMKLLFAKENLMSMIRLTSISALLFVVFYVSSVSISDNLGDIKIQYSEIMMGVAQMLGYGVMIPVLQKLKRVKSTLYFLISIFVIGAILMGITVFKLDRPGNFLNGTPY
jgi:hypothetical protein